MSDESVSHLTKDLILRDLYYSPKTGYRSAQHLYELAVQEDSEISKNFVKHWLLHQSSYSKFKKFNNPKHFRETFVRDLGEQVQIDLVVFLQKYSRENDDYKYLFVGIEILSRFAFAYPLKKKDGFSTRQAMQHFLKDFREKFLDYPKLIQFDEGAEFLNKDVIPLLKSKDITYFSTVSVRKASIVERLNRTLKEKMLKMFEKNGNKIWISYLNDLVENYNTQKHRSIGMTPAEVNESNKFTVWRKLFGEFEIEKPRYSVGDLVRVLKFSSKGQSKKLKKYLESKNPTRVNPKTGKKVRTHMVEARDKPPFSEEVFEIHEVLLGDPIVYKLYSPEAEVEILGKFYENELSLVK